MQQYKENFQCNSPGPRGVKGQHGVGGGAGRWGTRPASPARAGQRANMEWGGGGRVRPASVIVHREKQV